MNNNFWDLYNPIGDIKVGKDRIIKISYVKKGQTEGIDIRNFYRDKNNLKEKVYLPTQKGIVIPKENLEEFMNIINYKE